MSIEAFRWVVSAEHIEKAPERAVLYAIANYCSPQDKYQGRQACWVSEETLARACSMNRVSVSRIIQRLRKSGEIEVLERANNFIRMDGTRGATHVYILPKVSVTVPLEEVPVCNPESQSEGSVCNPEAPVCNPEAPVCNPGLHNPNRTRGNQESLPHGEHFAEAWAEWIQHRKEIRKPLKPTSTRQQLKKLGAVSEDDAVAMIEHTISMGWQGLRAPEPSRQPSPNRKPTTKYRNNDGEDIPLKML